MDGFGWVLGGFWGIFGIFKRIFGGFKRGNRGGKLSGDSAGGETGGDDHTGDGGEGRKIIIREPDDCAEEIFRYRGGAEELCDGFGGKIDRFDLFPDDAEDLAVTKGDHDDLAGEEGRGGGISK